MIIFSTKVDRFLAKQVYKTIQKEGITASHYIRDLIKKDINKRNSRTTLGENSDVFSEENNGDDLL